MMSVDEDAALMLRVKRGDREAFRTLVERYQRPVINMIYRGIGDAWEAEDLAQRVFVQVYRSARRYKPTAKFSTWLFTIVHNMVLNERRRRARHRAESLEQLQQPAEDGEGTGWQPADERAQDPAAVAGERELRRKIRAAIQKLPDEQRTAVILCRYEEVSYEEIGRVLGCSVAAVKSMLHRARVVLKERLSGHY
jgi:RNA polymerase sigma-70 factor (ECF subfamily)